MIYILIALAFNISLYSMNGDTHKIENEHALIEGYDIAIENVSQARLILKQLRDSKILIQSNNDQKIECLIDKISSLLMPSYNEKKLIAYIKICHQINQNNLTNWLKKYISKNLCKMKNQINENLKLFFICDSLSELQYLNNLGISYSIKDKENKNMLMLAILMHAKNITNYLLSNLTQFNINIFDKDIKGNTALSYAVYMIDEKTASALVKLGLLPQNQVERTFFHDIQVNEAYNKGLDPSNLKLIKY